MANILQQQPVARSVLHAPSPFAFGFALASSSSMAAAAWPSPPAFHQLTSSPNQYSIRAQKRRHDPDDDVDHPRHLSATRDSSMDRSPTPERPKRAPPKRARLLPHSEGPPKPGAELKENKDPSTHDDHDIDIGVLLASLPSQSLLPLLTSLLNAQPSLKSTILPLIPRPTLETATQALAHSAKKLRDAYPYSSSPTFGQSGISTSFGFGKTPISNPSAFGHSHHNGGMRDSYIISRLRPHVTDFVAACFSYLPYFSSLPALASSTTLQSLHRDKVHPSETFLFLSTITNHVMGQPPLAQSELLQQLLPRLEEEWKAWVLKVDDIVNQQGGMFGSETVRSWERTLDSMAEGKDIGMRAVRDLWVSRVGWLVGRTVQHEMNEY